MPDSPQGKMIQDLLRLNATRIQVVSTPTTRRLPIHFFDYVVRATFILYNDDSRAVEVEKLDEMQFPRQRFTKPVRIGIFVYGHPRPEPGLEQHDEQHQHAPAIMPGLPTDIDFPGVSAGITQEVKSAVARLHLNMGHPSKEELCRMMAQQMRRLNALANSDVRHVNAYDHHKHQDHLQPPSHSCQFGDEIQMDVVYCRTLSSTTIMILGAVDRATGFYQAALLPDRNASATFETFEQMWLKPYGLPLRVTCGPDTSFKGDFPLRPSTWSQRRTLSTRSPLCDWSCGTSERSVPLDSWEAHRPVWSSGSGTMPRFDHGNLPCLELRDPHPWPISISSSFWP